MRPTFHTCIITRNYFNGRTTQVMSKVSFTEKQNSAEIKRCCGIPGACLFNNHSKLIEILFTYSWTRNKSVGSQEHSSRRLVWLETPQQYSWPITPSIAIKIFINNNNNFYFRYAAKAGWLSIWCDLTGLNEEWTSKTV